MHESKERGNSHRKKVETSSETRVAMAGRSIKFYVNSPDAMSLFLIELMYFTGIVFITFPFQAMGARYF